MEFLSIIQSEAEKLLHVINEISAEFSGIKNNEKANCSNIVKSICKSLEFSAQKKKIKINTDIQDGLYVQMSESQIWRVASNILENAVKYNTENGEIHIKVYNKEKFAVLSVEDTGVGIEPQNISKIFNRGFREKSDSDGFGLGLANVRAIVSKYGGKIKVESQLKKGSKFTVLIPEYDANLQPVI
jgi:signal transduction histidine kinase